MVKNVIREIVRLTIEYKLITFHFSKLYLNRKVTGKSQTLKNLFFCLCIRSHFITHPILPISKTLLLN